jgi:hypothetical protein
VASTGDILRRGRDAPAGMVGFAVAAGLAVVWFLLPPTGSDLAAQVAHAEFARDYLWRPMDLRWFGGTDTLSYSVLVPPLTAALGVRLVGALATLASASMLGSLLGRCRVPRPRAGAIVGAVCLWANLVVGRLTFAVGMSAALATLLAVTWTHRSRWVLLVVGPLVTWAASPLAALFLALAGFALVVRRRGGLDGIVLTMAALFALAVSVWLGQDGYMPAPVDRGIAGLTACGLLAVTTRYQLLRIGAVLAAAGVALSLTVHTPVGMNALRLPELFAPALVVATSQLPLRWVVPAVVATVLWLPPLTSDDITAIGEPSNHHSYYSQLTSELGRLPLSGRVEIPPTLQRWESVYVARDFPLARGWMTQLDNGYNPLFFAAGITPAEYRSWLRDNAVQYVAVSDAAPAEAGVDETALIQAGLPYLHRVWSGTHWTIYRVAHPTTVVTGARLIEQTPASVAFRVEQRGTVFVRVRWSRWLTLDGPGGCLRPAGTWTDVMAEQPGTYRVGSALAPGDRHRRCDDS